jgi:hypothetical protein
MDLVQLKKANSHLNNYNYKNYEFKVMFDNLPCFFLNIFSIIYAHFARVRFEFYRGLGCYTLKVLGLRPT